MSSGFILTILLADGTYNGQVRLLPVNGSGSVTIIGNDANPGNVIIQNDAGSAVVGSNFSGTYTFIGVTFVAPNSYGNDVGMGITIDAGTAVLSNVVFGQAAWAHMAAGNFGRIYLKNNITITAGLNGAYGVLGQSAGHMYCSGGLISHAVRPNVADPTEAVKLSITNPNTYLRVFALADSGGTINYWPAIITGASNVTLNTAKYFATYNGIIIYWSGEGNVYPGGTAGSTTLGGQAA